MGRLVSGVVLVLFMGLAIVGASAQYRGSLQGTVTDAQGAVISGATVTMIDKETNRTLTTRTNEAGVYNIGSLPPSRYSLIVEKPGFKKKVLEDVGIISEQENAVNVVLSVGEIAETITVSGDAAPLLDTETANISGTITSQDVQTLPIYGRDPFQLLQLAPGAFGDGSQQAGGGANFLPSRNFAIGGTSPSAGIFGTYNSPAVSIGGSRQELTDIQIDGVGATDVAWGGTAIVTPNMDSIKEIKVVTNGYDAEEGRYSAGQVKVITQNGTNQYHGSAHWRMDRPGFNAYQRYNGTSPVTKDLAFVNDFGGSLGGPIKHDKLFGFFSYETIHASNGTNNAGWFETPQFRAAAAANTGSVAALMFGYKGIAPLNAVVAESPNDPSGVKNCAFIGLIEGTNCHYIPNQGLDIGSPLNAAQFPLGTPDKSFQLVLCNGQDPTTQPACPIGLGGDGSGHPSNLDGVPDIQYITQSYNQPSLEQQFQGRIDYNVTSKDLVAVSFFYVPNRATQANGSPRTMDVYQVKSRNKTGTVIWDRLMSSSLQNEFRANVGGWNQNTLKDNPNSPWGLPTLGIGNLQGGAGTIGTGGINGFGIGTPTEFDQWTYSGKDVLTKVYRSHTLKMGGDVSRMLFLDAAPWNARPNYIFNDIWDLMNDAPVQESAAFNPKTGVPSDFRFDSRETLYGVFVQDSYKMKPNLTLTAGLRWEYFGPMSDKYNHLPVVQLGQGTSAVTGVKIREGGNLFNTSKSNFGPELGFAWSPSQFNDKLVVRGGFGISYSNLQEGNSLDVRNNPPLLSSVLNLQAPNILYGVNSLPGSPTSFFGYASNPATLITFNPATNLPEPGQNFQPVNLVAFEQNWPTTRTYRYSLEIEHDLGREWVATIGYQGTESRHLTRLYNYGLFEYARLFAQGQAANAFNSVINSITMYDNEGQGNFNALLTSLKHRFGHSFQLESQYRWSKGLDTGSNNYSPAQHNGACSCDGGSYMFTMNKDYGPSDFDVTHYFKMFGTWSPTIFHSQKSFLEKTMGGWTLSGILNLHSGYPWNPNDPNMGANVIYQTSTNNIYGGGGILRPGYYLGGFDPGDFKVHLDPTSGNFIGKYPNGALSLFPENNPIGGASCYTAGPALSAIIAGTAQPGPIPCAPGIGRNSFRGPRYFDIDATIGKSFGLPPMKVLGENAKFMFTANFYNLFNNVNLVNIDPNVNSATFGAATSALGSRTIELQLRFSF
jgi:hypothetical protein